MNLAPCTTFPKAGKLRVILLEIRLKNCSHSYCRVEEFYLLFNREKSYTEIHMLNVSPNVF